ncbi:hypothetical protein MMC18_005861 [Xylographa bjoerkii]|nr:hypothetical protein [Xylographa bjoerkii]
MTSTINDSASLTLSSGGVYRKILIAVDFGTTYSGLCWAQTRRPDVQTPITQWPDSTSQGLEGISSDKVPTELRYGGNSYQWGFQIGDEEQRYQWFKVDLDPSQARGSSELARRYTADKALPPGYDVSAEKLVTDYLTALRKHAENILKHKLPESALKSTLIQYIMTLVLSNTPDKMVPAVWSDAAQAKTKACAEKAGMGRGEQLQIISEPEAAAVYALDAMNPHDIKVGDCGTVDLISYTVSALELMLKVNEASPGTGGLCGSTYLNRIFKEFLTAKLGSNHQWDDEVLEDALNRFELVTKRAFTGNPEENFTIPVPGLVDDPVQGVRRGRFILKGTDIVNIFGPVLPEIIALVKGQIASTRRHVKAVLLVGGFGQSVYLRESLRSALGTSTEVLSPPNGYENPMGLPDCASNGNFADGRRFESMSGPDQHASTMVQMANTDFEEGVHSTSRRRYWSVFHGVYRIRTMFWLIKKGDPVKEHEPKEFHYHTRNLVSKGPPQTIGVMIQSCTDAENTGAPMYLDSSVKDLVKLKADLSCIPESTIEQRQGKDGNVYYYCSWHIEMSNYSASTMYELVYKGVHYASVKAEYI